MNRFAVITPKDLAGASNLLTEPDRHALAGGIDLLDRMKQGIDHPEELISLKASDVSDKIHQDRAGMTRIGALTTLADIETNPAIRAQYPALAQSAGEAATPQIRNRATAGGNLLQRPRCWYYRNPDVPCLKKGGSRCYAVTGLNRYHAILGGGPSFIVHPSNLAPALIALGATVVLSGPTGTRRVELELFFVPPRVDPRRENVLEPGEILTEIILPATPRGSNSVYLEAREKQSFDWPLASAAVFLTPTSSGVIQSARIVLGAVAPIPWRSPQAEEAIRGHRVDAAVASRAAEAALKPAAPLSDNRYKVPIAKTLLRRAILLAAGVREET